EPASGRLVSLPLSGVPPVNALRIAAGRIPTPGAPREAVILESFAEAQNLVPGDELDIIVRDRQVRVSIVGTAFSPEYVFPGHPSGMSDSSSFVVVWMAEDATASLLGLGASFNKVAMTLQHEASE